MTRLFGLVAVIVVAFAGAGLMLGGIGGPVGGQASNGGAPRAQAVSTGAISTPSPNPVSSGPRIVALKADARGHFATDAQIDGRFVRVLVDTGASIVAMSAEDARVAGIDPPAAAYTLRMQTANGMVKAARVRIEELRLQSIVLRDVEAAVLPSGAFKGTLLGMSALKRLQAFEMQGGTLVLKQ